VNDNVMVFAPAPLLTVTVEHQHDTLELHLHPGGQGVWQARMITSLGVEVTLCSAIGGEVGHVLQLLAVAEGMTLRTINRNTSGGWYVHDRRDGERRIIAETAGEPLNRHELDELYGLALAEGLRAPLTVLSGPANPSVVPSDVYRRLARDLTGNGGRVIADLSGEELNAALAGGIFFVKVSHEELVRDGWVPDDGLDSLVGALHGLRAAGAGSVLISRGDKPALALLGGDVFEVAMPRLTEADHRGAGDSMTAGLAAVLARGDDLEEAVRTGAAAGALNATRHGLGTGRADAIDELIGRVRLHPARAAG
jgi:1-phosphofructokinase